MFFMAVLAASIFSWKRLAFLLSSWMMTAMLPKMFALMIAPMMSTIATNTRLSVLRGPTSLPANICTAW